MGQKASRTFIKHLETHSMPVKTAVQTWSHPQQKNPGNSDGTGKFCHLAEKEPGGAVKLGVWWAYVY